MSSDDSAAGEKMARRPHGAPKARSTVSLSQELTYAASDQIQLSANGPGGESLLSPSALGQTDDAMVAFSPPLSRLGQARADDYAVEADTAAPSSPNLATTYSPAPTALKDMSFAPLPEATSAPVVVNVQNISLKEDGQIPASSLITSISNPNNDTLESYYFYDFGTNGGYFTLNGVAQPDGQFFSVPIADLDEVDYVAGSSPGSETLNITVYDSTANAFAPDAIITASTFSAPPAGHLKINLVWDSSVASAPAGFEAAVTYAANYLDSIIGDGITLNINVGWGEWNNSSQLLTSSTNSSDVGLGGSVGGTVLTYTELKSALESAYAFSGSPADQSALANFPATDPSGGEGFYVSPAQLEAWGLASPTASATDGAIGFNSSFNYAYDPDGEVTPNAYNLICVATLELCHALGLGISSSSTLSVQDLFKYSSAGNLLTTPFAAVYFSTDGGVTGQNFPYGTTSDNTLFSVAGDGLDLYAANGTDDPFSPTDATELNVDGFNITSPGGTTPVVNGRNFSVGEGVSKTASSFIASISNPSGDQISEYAFWNSGAAPGYFTYSGGAQPIQDWIIVTAGNLSDLNYVSAASSGTDTIEVEVFDLTTATWSGAGEVTVTTVSDDLLQNGESDILIQNASGALVVGELSNGQLNYTQVGALGSGWTFEGVGDYLGDGEDQILIQNSSGAVVVGQIGANSQEVYTQIGALGSAWTFEGSGNFLDDGKDQFLIENTSGVLVVGEVGGDDQVNYTQVGVLGSGSSFHGAGNFLDNGKDQFLIQNTSGALILGEVGSNDQATYTQVGALGLGWTFEGVGDLLGDDKDQFLIENTSGAVVVGEVGSNDQVTYTQVGALGSVWTFEGVGDYTGTGTDSFLIENTSTGAVVTGTVQSGQAVYDQVGALGSEWSFPVSPSTQSSSSPLEDLLGDNLSDVLIQNASGAVVVGEVGSNGQAAYTQVGALGPEWSFEEVGDFLGGDQGQFLIENTSGAIVLAQVSNGVAGYTQVGALGSEWAFEGAGDYFGDGQDQFLIQNTSGAVVVGEVGSNDQTTYTQVGALGPEWTFEGSGDLLGDGKDQVLIQNTSGAVVVGEVGSNNQITYTQIGALGPEWSFEGVGDFLGDGRDQVLIENTSGAVVVSEVGTNDQTTYTQVGALGSVWKFEGVGDYTGSGVDSFLLDNTSTGAVVIGTVVSGQAQYTQLGALGSTWTFHNG